MSDTTTITLNGPYLHIIMVVISFFMENDPFLMGRGLHVDDSTPPMITIIDNIEDELEQKSVKVSGPFRLVMYLRKLIHQTLVRYIDVVDSPQGKSIFEIAETVADESDGPDGWCNLHQSETNEEMDSKSTLSSSKCESLGKCNDLLFYNYNVKSIGYNPPPSCMIFISTTPEDAKPPKVECL